MINADGDKVKSPKSMDELDDGSHSCHSEEASTTHEEEDNNRNNQHGKANVSKAHRVEDPSYGPMDTSSWSEEDIDQRSSDHSESRPEHNDDGDRIPECPENDLVPIAAEIQKLGSIDEQPITETKNIPMSGCLSDLQGPSPSEKVSPSERYKPRPYSNLLPARPSLARAFATYDSRPNDDSERKFPKRVSFQQPSRPLYTPPSTSNSSPVSPASSPQLPFRTILAKPPPVSIPPGQYTPLASASTLGSYAFPPISPATRKAYSCLQPACDSSFDDPYDRDRHERQHGIGDPAYSQCPVCRYSRSSGAAVDGGLREHLIAHMYRKHRQEMESKKGDSFDYWARRSE